MFRFSAPLTALVFLTVAFATAPAHGGDEGKCTIATKPETEVGKACATGGRAAAKKNMKEMVKKAKANGQKFTCDGCHKDLDNFGLTANGQEDFKKLLAVAK